MVIFEKLREGGITQRAWKACTKRLTRAWVIAETQVAADDVFEQAHRLTVDDLRHHVVEHSANGVEALIRLADVGKTHVVQQDFLDNEDGDSLAQLAACLHDAQAKRDDLSREQKGDHI